MRYRRLGKGEPEVSALGLGRGSAPLLFDAAFATSITDAIHRALDLGINFFDSSDAYWNTRHEALLGVALRGRRREAIITTKCGYPAVADDKQVHDGRPQNVAGYCERSLARLGIDEIDVYYLHRVDPAVPVEDTIGAMSRLVEQGKVRYLGISSTDVDTLRRAHAIHPLVALQSEYSLWNRECEDQVLPLCRELDIAYVCFAPLGRGFLTGQIKNVDDLPLDDKRRTFPQFESDTLARNKDRLAALEALAAARSATSAQVALAWLLAQGEDIIPIPGTNHAQNVALNAAASTIDLNREELAALDALFAAPQLAAAEPSERG